MGSNYSLVPLKTIKVWWQHVTPFGLILVCLSTVQIMRLVSQWDLRMCRQLITIISLMVFCGEGEGVNAIEICWSAGGSVLRSKSVEKLISSPSMGSNLHSHTQHQFSIWIVASVSYAINHADCPHPTAWHFGHRFTAQWGCFERQPYSTSKWPSPEVILLHLCTKGGGEKLAGRQRRGCRKQVFSPVLEKPAISCRRCNHQ